jgi:prolyl-tRNA editing enzyme YbaK/EbsC (Cys-tRNA(Pro) deacylase)
VGAIVKSLVFRCGDDAVLALVSGANRADEARLEAELGAPVQRADAALVRAATGFSIEPAELARLAGGRVVRLAAPAR